MGSTDITLDNYFSVCNELSAKILTSSNLEDIHHAGATDYWVTMLLEGKQDLALSIAAWGSDIEKAYKGYTVNPKSYSDYESYRAESNKASASIVANIMRNYGISEEAIEDVVSLISQHHISNHSDKRVKVLCDADSLSFLHMVSPLYCEGDKRVLESRYEYEYNRLSEGARNLFAKVCLHYPYKSLNDLYKKCTSVDSIKSIEDKAEEYMKSNGISINPKVDAEAV